MLGIGERRTKREKTESVSGGKITLEGILSIYAFVASQASK